MLRAVTAAVMINRAIGLAESNGSPARGLKLAQRALDLCAADDGALARIHTARAHQVRAECLLALDRVDEGLAAYEEADRCFSSEPDVVELHVRCLHDAAITCANIGLEDLARTYARKGAAAAADLDGPYREDFARLLLELEFESEDVEQQSLGALRHRLAEVEDPATERIIARRLATAACARGGPDDVAEAFAIVHALHDPDGSLHARIAALTPLAHLDGSRRALPAGLRKAVEQVVGDLRPTTDTDTRADAHLLHAVVLSCEGDLRAALDAALHAVALRATTTWRTATSVVRSLTGERRGTAGHVALRLACELGDAELAAELIESSRLSALPDVSAASERIELRVVDKVVSVARRPFGPLHPISVGGRSRLAPYYAGSLRLGAPIRLEAMIESVGGAEAWWWGASVGVRGAIFWAVRDPSGTYSCGQTSTDDRSRALLRTALEMTPDEARRHAGELSVFHLHPRTEQDFSVELGDLLLPPPLRSAFTAIDRHHDEARRPASVVLAGNVLSKIPVVLLGVSSTSATRPRRLLEYAVCRVAPPAALVAALGAAPRSGTPYPLRIVCTDATGELEHATLPFPADHVLGYAAADDRERVRPATLENLVAALRDVGPTRAVFAYAGHASEGDHGPDLESHLPLADGEALVAESLFAGHADGLPIPFPERVLLAACGSAGSTGAGSGEWLGLTAGALSAGSREVIGTAWPIWDLPMTRELDAALLEVLQHDDDIATGLRALQLERLERWLADSEGARAAEDPSAAFPLVWASYQYVGCPPSQADPPA